MIITLDTQNIDLTKRQLSIKNLKKGVYEVIDGDQVHVIEVLEVNLQTKYLKIRHKHVTYEMEFKDELDLVLDQMGIKLAADNLNSDVKAPMPGKVLDVMVKEGDQVSKGDALLILEAMKMENVLKAESDCSIKKVHVASSENVEKNQVLVELEA